MRHAGQRQSNFAFHHIVRTLEGTPSWNLHRVRALIDTSEPCKPETFELFRDVFVGTGLRTNAVQASYGLAENVFAVTQTEMSAPPRILVVHREQFSLDGRVVPISDPAGLRLVSCGKPLDTAVVSIVGSGGVELPEGRVGEIAVGGETLFDGYYRAEAPSLRGGRFFTGDLGFSWEGELYVVGRAEDMLIINGRNLHGHEAEHAVNLYTSVKPGRCIALGVFNPTKGSEDLALVVEVDGGAADSTLRKQLAEVVLSATGISLSSVHFVEPGWLHQDHERKIARRANLEKLMRTSR